MVVSLVGEGCLCWNDERADPDPTSRPNFFSCRLRAYSFVLRMKEDAMLYAILCYNSEDVVTSWSKEEDDAVMAKLAVVETKLLPML